MFAFWRRNPSGPVVLHRPVLIAALVVGTIPGIAAAQRANGDTYTSIAAGIAFQDQELGVRTHRGGGAVLAFGRQFGLISMESRMGAAVFGAPEQYVSPGGCLGASSCTLPVPRDVRSISLGLGARAEATHGVLLPSALLGLGMRRVSGSASGAESRPYVEAGAGIGARIRSMVLSVDGSLQVASTARDVPGRFALVTARARF